MTTALLLSTVLVPLSLASLATWRYGPWLAMIAPIPAVTITFVSLSPEIVTLEWRSGVRLVRHAYIKSNVKSYLPKIDTPRVKLWQSVAALLNSSLQPRIATPKWAWIGTLWMTVVGLVIMAITTG